jgi:hypothetical protein
MVMMMSETADTSKRKYTVSQFNKDQVSRIYSERPFGENLLRFNLPEDQTVFLGLQFRQSAYLYKKLDSKKKENFYISSFSYPCPRIGETLEALEVQLYNYKENGDPRSCLINQEDDPQFILLPQDWCNLEDEDVVEFQFVKESGLDTERYIEVHVG